MQTSRFIHLGQQGCDILEKGFSVLEPFLQTQAAKGPCLQARTSHMLSRPRERRYPQLKAPTVDAAMLDAAEDVSPRVNLPPFPSLIDPTPGTILLQTSGFPRWSRVSCWNSLSPRTGSLPCPEVTRNDSQDLFDVEFSKLHINSAIQQVLSNIFLVCKKTGEFRPVINLRALNSFIDYPPFSRRKLIYAYGP